MLRPSLRRSDYAPNQTPEVSKTSGVWAGRGEAHGGGKKLSVEVGFEHGFNVPVSDTSTSPFLMEMDR